MAKRIYFCSYEVARVAAASLGRAWKCKLRNPGCHVIMSACTACALLFPSFVTRFAAVGAVRMQFDAGCAVAATRQSLEKCAAARFAENMRAFAIVAAAAAVSF